MVIQVHRVDKDGFYMEPVLIEQNDVIEDENIVTIDPPEGLYKPRWLDGEWLEGLTSEEIEEIKKTVPQEPDPIEQLQAENAALMMQVAQLEAKNEQQAGDTAFLILKNVELEAQATQTAQEQASLLMELTMKGVL
ncbi:hypothetical protein [Aneurinibacillus migulanus]|uniref:Bacteriophage SP-beta YorD domain-containing protein n=1 Tax=Aneurinibacillus migulanus TaxID=47500 RepID=A0A0D1XZI4_ANEMI|nr:hypothetical protein [Aneurinibacillus migulanus]KIV59596.1 hypothetical protein TS65_02650 [Aneurinibacillus migulanus]KON93123.1 hypothetical protein AF333_25995 [Aneurinibacillus migulanus]MED0890983.1 hypothetical protein [Aneurinibacillus migulanus]MED1614624.1 hypothetical protein [Aneurinibacillus migulanus]SDK31229.1 hypothetical protein SAMN04487909_14838 [Aneurinibacillus migulanus]